MTTIKNVTSSQAPTQYQQLVAIFDKVTRGVALTALEDGFLSRCAEKAPSLSSWAWSFVSTPADEESVQTINCLAAQIQTCATPATKVITEVEQKLKSSQQPTIRETASFAKLIQSCLYREDVFTSLISRFRAEYKREPTRNDLIKVVAQYNNAASPVIQAAGQAIAHFDYINDKTETPGRLTVRYNQEGYLEITEGSLTVLDTSFKQKLTNAQVAEMHALYNRLSQDTPFNNLGEMLDFINYYNQQKTTKPELTLKQALDAYNPNLPQIFDKYRSGTCILLSAKFCHELANRGINAQMLATTALNPWSTLPIPGKEVEVPWTAFTEELQNVGHTDAVCFFNSEDGLEKIARYRCSFEKDLDNEVTTYTPAVPKGALSRLLFDIGEFDLPNRVSDSGKIGKTRLIGKYKAVIRKDEMIFGVDFLRGNLYLKPTPGRDALRGLPLNEKGLVSIELSNLTKPETKGFYSIDGVKTELSHREALKIIVERAGNEVYLPAGIEEDLILLAQNAPALMADFFIQPMPLIKAAFPDLLAIDKKLKALESKVNSAVVGNLLVRYESEVITEIYRNSPDALEKVRAFRAEIEKL